ncbi:DsbA family protein [Candidatus Parcubacteria bacterium]|nr:DsbA family protein [Candidatus Parcubacteria bacterium]
MRFVIGTIIGILIIAAGIFIFWPDETPATTQNTSASTAAFPDMPSAQTTELIIGDPDAKATIIEYADYKCPSCGEFHQNAGKQLRANYVDKGLVKIIFRPFPVYAVDGAQALIGSYCALDQQKFSEYHDALFEYMWVNHFRAGDYQKAIDSVLTEKVMNDLLGKIGMDAKAYKECMDSKRHEKAYYDTIELAAPDDIQGTPSFIINDQKIVGPQPYSVFKTLVDIQLR